ncbi:hypothetical protein ACFS07_35480 [Undibacterium arcticum]
MTTNELWTLGIAGYAAVVSMFVLGWDAYKWLDSGPKVRLTASTGMKNGWRWSDRSEKHMCPLPPSTSATELRRSRTLVSCTTAHGSRQKFRQNKPDKAFIISGPSQVQVIPYRFEAGAQWIGLADQGDDVVKLIRDGCLFVVLYHSHGGKGVRHRLNVKEPTT